MFFFALFEFYSTASALKQIIHAGAEAGGYGVAAR